MFQVITADCPWLELGGGKIKRGADRHYPLLKTPEIIELLTERCEPLERVNPERSALFLWVTNNFLRDGLEVVDALGYRYVTAITWAKTRIGLGYYFRGQTEHALFCVKGKWPRPPEWSSTLLGGGLIPRTEHSKKPVELAEMIERRFEGPYLELFARETRPGWTAWGNEIQQGWAETQP
jgi:N6-adenosine-specific RNA methylase IME4